MKLAVLLMIIVSHAACADRLLWSTDIKTDWYSQRVQTDNNAIQVTRYGIIVGLRSEGSRVPIQSTVVWLDSTGNVLHRVDSAFDETAPTNSIFYVRGYVIHPRRSIVAINGSSPVGNFAVWTLTGTNVMEALIHGASVSPPFGLGSVAPDLTHYYKPTNLRDGKGINLECWLIEPQLSDPDDIGNLSLTIQSSSDAAESWSDLRAIRVHSTDAAKIFRLRIESDLPLP
jgi:hypothetical protein